MRIPPLEMVRVAQHEYIADLYVRDLSIGCVKQGWELELLTAQDCVKIALSRFKLGLVKADSAEERIALLLSDRLSEVAWELDTVQSHEVCDYCDELWFFVRLSLLRIELVGVEEGSFGYVASLLSESPRRWLSVMLDPFEPFRPYEHGDAGYFYGVFDGVLVAQYYKYCREVEVVRHP